MNLQLSDQTNISTVASQPILIQNNSINNNQQKFTPVTSVGGITATGLSTTVV